MVKETDRAWAAGYFDGEGHVGYTHPSDRNVGRINLSVSQKDRRSLDRFAQIVGVGKVYERDASVPYQWAATNVADKFAALKVLWPYLDEIKRAAAADAWAQYVIDRTPKPPRWFTANPRRIADMRAGVRRAP